jgi:hypothetical protein
MEVSRLRDAVPLSRPRSIRCRGVWFEPSGALWFPRSLVSRLRALSAAEWRHSPQRKPSLHCTIPEVETGSARAGGQRIGGTAARVSFARSRNIRPRLRVTHQLLASRFERQRTHAYEPIAGTTHGSEGGSRSVLRDLWGAPGAEAVAADPEPWYGFWAGAEPAARPRAGLDRPFVTARDARDHGADFATLAQARRPSPLRSGSGGPRGEVERSRFGQWFVHRTGHTIRLRTATCTLSGPHLDDYETHEERRLRPGGRLFRWSRGV